MPYCGRIESFTIAEHPDSWGVTVWLHYSSRNAGLSDLIPKIFPGSSLVRVGTLQSDGEWIDVSTGEFYYTVPKESVQRDVLEGFLQLLHWSVTIADDADESHALQVHEMPPSDGAEERSKWAHTEMGRILNQAKSYDMMSGDRLAAMRLAEQFVDWIQWHPKYRSADAVVAPPAGNPNKKFDLPSLLASQIAGTLGMAHVESRKTKETHPQKDVGENQEELAENVHGSMVVEEDLSGRIALVVDDLYKSGATVCELTRACKAAGASAVLALTATKAAKFCNGFSAGRWRDTYEEAGNSKWDWAYD